jgi:hypothetical protein
VATCHLFCPVALTDVNAGKLDACVGRHGVCLNVLQGQGQLHERNRILKWIVYTLLYFYISGSQASIHISYVNNKPNMVRLSYCKEDTSGYSPVSNIFCKYAAILHRLQNKGKLDFQYYVS